jgi:cyclopropane-fatty-acyl-phospholipid synthase
MKRKYTQLANQAISGSYRGEPRESVAGTCRSVNPLDRWIVATYARLIGNPPVALALWDGRDVWRPPGGRTVGRVVFHDRDALIGVLFAPETGFGDGVTTGRIEIRGDLVDVLHRSFRCWDHSPLGRLRRSVLASVPRPWRGSLTDSRRNIHYHYDLGNEFYRLWLDERMVYTCAYYTRADLDLEAAQVAKMNLVCRKLALRPGMRVAEAGCGWGALALHMARNFGVQVRAYNISTEQIRFARERARAEGIDSRVEFIEDDYRNLQGEFDAFVSVGMLEHVGPENYRHLGMVIERCLKPDGMGLIHSIGRNRRAALNAWTTRRIFPGSHAPSLREMMDIFEASRFSVLDVENLRLHYARTTMDWLARFDAREPQIRGMYDEAFVRAWRLYLASSAAAFLAGNLQLFQVVFAGGGCNRVPMSREHLFDDSSPEFWHGA